MCLAKTFGDEEEEEESGGERERQRKRKRKREKERKEGREGGKERRERDCENEGLNYGRQRDRVHQPHLPFKDFPPPNQIQEN